MVRVCSSFYWDRVLFDMPQLVGAMLAHLLLSCTQAGASGLSMVRAMPIHFESQRSSGGVLQVILWGESASRYASAGWSYDQICAS